MRFEDTVWCDGCGMEIVGAAEVIEEHDYCCSDCAQGYKCGCQPEFEVSVETRPDGREGLPRFWENP